jgi:hypothetical protein
LAAASGCYDGGALVEARRQETNLVRLDEIDMGGFRITLPHVPGEPGGGVVDFHVFGQVARRDRDKVSKALRQNAPELRYRILLLVRALSREELDDPKLTVLRGRIKDVANAALDKKVVKNIGFYRFTVTAL